MRIEIHSTKTIDINTSMMQEKSATVLDWSNSTLLVNEIAEALSPAFVPTPMEPSTPHQGKLDRLPKGSPALLPLHKGYMHTA